MAKHKILTIANGITIGRIALLPLLAYTIMSNHPISACVLVSIIGFTDIIDGYIARKFKEESQIGKLLDPVADKLFLCVALCLCLYYPISGNPLISPILATLLLCREFFITSLRAIAASLGIILAAGSWGKFKTILQFVGMGCFVIGFRDFLGFLDIYNIGLIILWISLGISYYSMILYIKMIYQQLSKENLL